VFSTPEEVFKILSDEGKIYTQEQVGAHLLRNTAHFKHQGEGYHSTP